MSGELNLVQLGIGAVSLLIGLGLLAAALRQDRESPKGVAMLIGGMMAAAFGLLMASFAIAFAYNPSPLGESGPVKPSGGRFAADRWAWSAGLGGWAVLAVNFVAWEDYR